MARYSFIAAIILIFVSNIFGGGHRIRIKITDANEPYTAAVHAVNGLFMMRQEGKGSQTMQFALQSPGYYMLDVRFRSGLEYAKTVFVAPGAAESKSIEMSLSRNDAFYAKDLAKATHRISVASLRHEEDLVQAVRDFERALGNDDAERAEEILSEVLDGSPGAALAWNNLGALRLQQNRPNEALLLLKQAHRIDPGLFEANLNLARAYGVKQHTEAAIRYTKMALEQRPSHPNALSMIVGTLFLAGKREEALPYLELLRQIDPEHVCNPDLLLASILQDRGELRQAAELVLAFVQRHPEHEEAGILQERASHVLARTRQVP